ncbi:MAG: hypothetical protein AABY93_11740 [Bacteroidota bacterium]
MQESTQDDLIRDFKRRVEATLPNLPVANWGYGIDFHVSYGSSNYGFRNSRYFIEPAGQRFFHLTSYRNLFSIINSGTFRLYNLSNSDDANELSSFKDVGLTQDQIDRIKERIFTMSFCNVMDIANKQLWDEYGKVAIVFEILNGATTWNNFHLSKVYYEPNTAFREYFVLEQEFKKRLKIDFSHDSLRDLIAFHKNEELKWEREIRLMYLPSLYEHQYDELDDFKTSEHHTGFTRYIELALFVENSGITWAELDRRRVNQNLSETYYIDRPKIKITAIKFGDNEEFMDQEKFDKLYYEIKFYLMAKFGYSIEVDQQLFHTDLKPTKK